MNAVALALVLLSMNPSESRYVAETLQWRQDSEARLKADEGWLTVAGLYWLKEGENRAGTEEANPIVLPAGSAPAFIGTFRKSGARIEFEAARGVAVTHEGKPVGKLTLQSDAGGAQPDRLAVRDLTMFVIKRGERYAIRLRDKNSKMRREFTHRTWFPVKEEYRIRAKWQPYNPAKSLPVPNILGETEREPCPGVAIFQWHGVEYRLEPVLEDGRLFFIFKDRTAGKKTYPAGRFLYSDVGADGSVILDFNRAYNPPCAFTPYATCPLPPKQNQLPVEIEAGELTYHHQ